MFDFVSKFPFASAVKVRRPQPDGSIKEFTFTAKWEAQDRNELNAFQQQHAKGSTYALLEMALKGLEGITEGGTAMENGPATWEKFIATDDVAVALVASYWEPLQGLREKN